MKRLLIILILCSLGFASRAFPRKAPEKLIYPSCEGLDGYTCTYIINLYKKVNEIIDYVDTNNRPNTPAIY